MVATLSNEKKRLHHSQKGIDKKSIERPIKFLEEAIQNMDKALHKTVPTSEALESKTSILKSIPGIG